MSLKNAKRPRDPSMESTSNANGAHDAPNTRSNAKGILKRKARFENNEGGEMETQTEDQTKRGVVWDEDNLIYNESTRTSTMKITEPLTPYNHDYNSEEEDGSSSEGEFKSPREGSREEKIKAHFDKLSSALEDQQSKGFEDSPKPGVSDDEKEGEKPNRRSPRFANSSDEEKDSEKPAKPRFANVSDDEKDPKEEEEFRKKRTQHYNEWKKLQEFRKLRDGVVEEAEDEQD